MKARESKSSKKIFIVIAVVVALIAGIGFFIFNKMNAESNQKKVPVLQYYYLAKDKDKKGNPEFKDKKNILSVSEFEKQIKYLADNKYHTLTLKEFEGFIKDKKSLPEKSVLITFDNSSKSNYVYAYPILKKYKMHAVSFAVSSKLTEQVQKFDPKNIQRLSKVELEKMKDVFEIGSHTHDLHKEIDNEPALIKTAKEDVKKDILQSNELLQTKYFSYPFGKYNKASVEAINELKVELAFTSAPGYATENSGPLEINRWFISSGTTIDQFSKIVSGKYEIVKK
ncbi:Two component regulator three Y motif [Bacillus cereus 95/8201]|uniref:polysaccharide deacetylase family protein n=1 Tax=Bacillus cereus group TaxID=86661 RepID=UPI0001A0946A|nr:polysaccharide deacetylase family protein [Bacillus cereus]AJH63071.1 polysaccharide deacetylase family protein [Bacillus cereus]AJK36512.1 polysaccharide deacetylase family protein [Bacillus cereus]EEL14319.1 Two component regulator three Y motif [Bacillus cereus 95/8201]KWU64729.1 transcriptional regulator [Bacillus cereus]MDQ4440238.1 polysaccharide deacetylase family protein [Bacillus cereus]